MRCRVLQALRSKSARAASMSTSAVRVGHEFDVGALLGELRAHGVDGGEGWAGVAAEDVAVKQFTHGQSNPTYLVDFGGRQRAVLRKKPPGVLLKGAHNVAREFRCMDALGRHTTVPVPRMLPPGGVQGRGDCTNENPTRPLLFAHEAR